MRARSAAPARVLLCSSVGFAGQGRLGAEAGEQVVGQQLREGFCQLDVRYFAITVQVERFEQALVDLPPDAGWCCRVVLVAAPCYS